MSDVKLIVMYPRPKDIEAFEKLYQDEHVPMAVEKLSGKTKLIATRVVATPDGTPPTFYRIAEVYFPSLQALQACAAVRRWQGDRGPCREDLQRRGPGVSGRRRADVYFWRQFRVGPAENAGVPLIYHARSLFDPLTLLWGEGI